MDDIMSSEINQAQKYHMISLISKTVRLLGTENKMVFVRDWSKMGEIVVKEQQISSRKKKFKRPVHVVVPVTSNNILCS